MSQTGILVLLAALAAQAQHQAHHQAETSCMTEALYYEARGEGVRGQEAVAEVILQRTRTGSHPKSVCGVVHQPYQFSYLTDGSTKRKRDPEAWDAASQLAARILKGDIVTSMTRKATFYHTADVLPDWASAMVVTARIGDHVFYRPKPQQRLSSAQSAKRPSTT
jgi:spore germination cell wall hydrolase CwlJ-like protein